MSEQKENINLFGTDGLRGKVNTHMTAEMALNFGIASGIYMSDLKKSGLSVRNSLSHSRAVIAKDTRLSGYMLEPALTAGLIAVGIDVILVGPMPTPAVPMLVKSLRADFGIMITASHNPYYDNGFKLFNSYGNKLDHSEEQTIQNLMFEPRSNFLATSENLGRARRLDDAHGRYIEYIKNAFPKSHSLSGLKVVLDCANGSAYRIAPTILWELGADILTIHCEPNGLNINHNCGAIHTSDLSKKVIETSADIGIALDGDGDRVVFCDEKGQIIEGDKVLALVALNLKKQNILQNNAIVATQVSNTMLEKFLNNHGIKVWTTQVGDRNVAKEMSLRRCNFGGEQSGHLIFSDYSNSGDGILGALQVLSVLKTAEKKTSELFDLFSLNPYINNNISYHNYNPLDDNSIKEKLLAIQQQHDNFRIIVRKSGTEKLIRIMVEGCDKDKIQEVMLNILSLLQTNQNSEANA